ncbi:MAG: MFS transporter [Deltaproteobacteria bacterium]|jgi:predicted MFS family arabinose efflux permease|nr:MFS transporter [Deltaproteobacteria bacterium]
MINLCIFVGFDMLLPTLSLYLVDMGCSKEVIGFIFSTFAVSAVTSRLLASRLSQKLGALPVVRVGLLLCGSGAILFFAIQQEISYALARLLFGAGYGLTSTLIISMAAQSMPPSRLGEGVAYLGLGATVALAIGPLVGLWLVDNYGYGILFSAVALCYLLATSISLTLPKVSLAAPDKSQASLKNTLRVLKPVFKTSLLIFVYGLAVSGVSAYLAVYCQEKSLPSAAQFFVISTIGTLAARISSGRLYDRFGHRLVVPPAIFLIVIAILLIYLTEEAFVFYLASIIYGVGGGSLFPALQAMTLSSTPMTHRASSSALFYNAFDVGIGLGVISLGLVAGFTQTYRTVFLWAAIFMVSIVFFYFLFFPKSRPQKT